MLRDDLRLTLVTSWREAEEFISWLGQRREVLAVDTETAGLDWWRDALRTVQFGDATGGWVIPHQMWGGLAAEALRRYDGRIAMHNFKFDVHMLEANGYSVPLGNVDDTRTMAHLLNPSATSGLKDVAVRMIDPGAAIGEQVLKKAMQKHKWTWATVPIDFEPYWAYGALDTVFTAELWRIMQPAVRAQFGAVYDVEIASQQVLLRMERKGARIDIEYARRRRRELLAWSAEMRDWARDQHGVENLTSGAQVAAKLVADGWEPTEFTPTGKPSTKEEVLAKVDHPIAQAMIDVRHAEKMAESYFGNFENLRDDDLLHPKINPIGARTGRMSVTDPALQTLPRSALVRDAFIPREGNRLVLIDYDQMEARLLAHFAEEHAMLEIIRSGEDLHSATARRVYGLPPDVEPAKAQRQLAKNGVYAKIYGAGVETFAHTVGVSLEEARQFLQMYDATFPGVRQFQRRVEGTAFRRAEEEGEAYVVSPLGRRHSVDRGSVYKLVNYLIQGTGADVLKQKLVELDLAGFGEYMVLPVHDEVVFDVPADEAQELMHEAVGIMEEHEQFVAPLTCDGQVVERWGEKYKEAS